MDPVLTRDVPPLAAKIKERPGDFVVEELPLYEPAGRGDHCYFAVRKTGVDTFGVIRAIARALGRRPREFGCAGLKDAAAVTTQVLSIEHVAPARVESLDVPGIEVLWAARHTNKLRMGHLRGNRFTVCLRETEVTRVSDVTAILETLRRVGLPNYFGRQRFGAAGRTWRLGRELLREEWAASLRVLLGGPGDADTPRIRRARELFDAGRFEAAVEEWPRSFPNERQACRALAESPDDPQRALSKVDRRAREFYLSAYQAHLFNQVVAARLDALNRLMAGDLAWVHRSGACFAVEDAAQEQPRCDAFEVSPSGPLFGSRMSAPQGAPGKLEARILESEGLTPDAFRRNPLVRAKGARRPLRVRPEQTACRSGDDDHGAYIELQFELPPGCYATALLREICKSEL